MNATPQADVAYCRNCGHSAKTAYFVLAALIAESGDQAPTLEAIGKRLNVSRVPLLRSLTQLVACGHVRLVKLPLVTGGVTRVHNTYAIGTTEDA